LILRFALVKAFTNAATFRSNPSVFSLDSELNPPSNFDGGNDDNRLLLLLFPKGGLLLLFPQKVLNPPNEFVSIVLKYEKCSPPVFPILVALFC